MPTYQYSCTECGHFFEQFQSFSDASLTTCPECSGKLRKVFNAVGVVFKGSGFYRTDSRTESRSESRESSSAGGEGSGTKESGKDAGGGGKDGGSKESGGKESGSKDSKVKDSSTKSAGSGEGKRAGSGKSSESAA